MSGMMLDAMQKARFGVEDLLEADADVYFQNIFSTRHIGRVVDFMLFQCQPFLKIASDPAFSEYRFRHIVELAIFNGWANYRAGERSKVVELEFGWDNYRLVISSTHIAEDGLESFVPGAEPVGAASVRMQKMLVQIQALADGLVVRHDPTSGRVQIVAFLTAHEEEKMAGPQYLDLSKLQVEAPLRAGDAAVPENLSSADIDAFLADESKAQPVMDEAGLAQDEQLGQEKEDTTVLSGDGVEQDGAETAFKREALPEEGTRIGETGVDETKIVVGGGKETLGEDQTKSTVSGGDKYGEDKTKMVIAGGREKLGVDTTKSVVGGGGSSGPNTEIMHVKRLGGVGGVVQEGSTDVAFNRREQVLLDKIKSMNAQIMALQSEKLNAGYPVGEADSLVKQEAGADGGEAGDRPRERLLTDQKKMMSEQISSLTEQINALRADKNELQALLAESNRNAAEQLAKLAAEAEESPEIIKYKKEMASSNGMPSTAKNWVTGMMEVLTKERAEVRLKSRDIDNLMRRREYEFKTKESGFVEQLRLMEGMIKQRESALQQSKESNSHLSAMIDKLRSENAGGQDSVELAHKLVTAEKLLQAEKDATDRIQKRFEELQKRFGEETSSRGLAQQETAKVKRQADDLQRKLSQLQESGQKGSSTEVLNLTDQRDKAMRQVEQLKLQNRELQAKLTANSSAIKTATGAKDGAKTNSTQTEAGLKHKLELAEKLAKVSKEELDKIKKRFEELKLTENKLRGELSKAQGDLVKAQTELKAAGIRSASAVAVAAKTAGPTATTKPKPKV